jgi:hypothetical protein
VFRSTIERYVSGERITASEAGAALRLAFAGLFMAQTVAALVVALVVGLATDVSGGANSILGIVLVVLALVQGPAGLAAALAPLPDPEEIRTAALHRVLLSAVLLSTPAWYLAFLFVTGGSGWPVYAVLASLVAYWILGVLLATRLGVRAAER